MKRPPHLHRFKGRGYVKRRQVIRYVALHPSGRITAKKFYFHGHKKLTRAEQEDITLRVLDKNYAGNFEVLAFIPRGKKFSSANYKQYKNLIDFENW